MSPITRETLAARIATLEADSAISIKEQFYLQTMRLLLAEMDKAPHHNGMMQLSNDLANAKAALLRLAKWARRMDGDINYTGDHPIAVAEKLAGNSPEIPECSMTLSPEGAQLLAEIIGGHAAVVTFLTLGRPDLALEESSKWVEGIDQAADLFKEQEAKS